LQDAGLEIISGGTDNHLMMVDLRAYSVTGLDAENALGQAGMTVNKNMIPGDPQAARITSGIRLGSPALTTRGFKEEHMKQVGSWIVGILKNIGDESLKVRTRAEIREFVKSFPLFQS